MEIFGFRVHKFNRTTTTSDQISSDELKEKMFPWVYDSKSISDIVKRREFLTKKMKEKFPNANYFVGLND